MLFPTRCIPAESGTYLRTADIVICIGVQILIGSQCIWTVCGRAAELTELPSVEREIGSCVMRELRSYSEEPRRTVDFRLLPLEVGWNYKPKTGLIAGLFATLSE
ncbi:hypothetical protein CEXT_399571 [Caerostris extrusa]|uniref:Uncharacterized protein n=1 Tax=Caerostris extrusa TaxID=172846 RepID=A0AAV4QIR6_CAEEX|nr:hypothetical protein CEXT_399571 [Caerostris extrusa]